MPFTAAGKNAMLNALSALITHLGLFDADAGKSCTGTASTDIITCASHGYSNGNLVVFSGLTGGSGLVAGRPYFVVGASTGFQVALTPGGSAVNFTSDLSAGTVTRLVELSGGSPAYARRAVAWNTAADGSVDDSTNGAVFDVPAGADVDYVGSFSALTSGTLYAIDQVTNTPFASQGQYTVTDADLDLLTGT